MSSSLPYFLVQFFLDRPLTEDEFVSVSDSVDECSPVPCLLINTYLEGADRSLVLAFVPAPNQVAASKLLLQRVNRGLRSTAAIRAAAACPVLEPGILVAVLH